MPVLLSLYLLAAPVDAPKPPMPRAQRVGWMLVTGPALGGLMGAAGYAAAFWATRSGGGSPWVTRGFVAGGWALGVGMGTWVASLRNGSHLPFWVPLLGSAIGTAVSLAVWAGVGGRTGDAAGATMLVMLPIFSSTALSEVFDLP
ncbi:MAG: hypothetical protein JNK82_38370 [Myxococcaceae bacterium]|nr:hypothetical protein [Myxococcaceae bacterium]